MKNVFYTFILICLTVLSSRDVLSHDKNSSTPQKNTKNDVKLPVSGKVNFELLRSKGNINERAIGYGLSLKIKGMKNNEVFLKIKGDKGEIQQITYTDEVEASALDIYHLNDISGIYGKVTYYKNEPRGYESQRRIGGGYLHTFYQNDLEDKYFKTRIGYQNRNNHYTTNVNDHQDYLQLGCRLKHPFMKNISIKTELNYMIDFSDSKDYEIENLLSFVFNVNKKIDIEIEYERLYSNIPVFDKQKTDSYFGTSLIYKF